MLQPVGVAQKHLADYQSIARFQQAMQKDDQSFVKLPKEIPVRLLYHTAFWDGSRIQFRPDEVERSPVQPDGIVSSIAQLPEWLEQNA